MEQTNGKEHKTQSPELAGGAGFTFEGGVGAFYLAALLGEGYAPGIENRMVSRVAFRQRNFGEPLDDVIVDFRAATGEEARLSVQGQERSHDQRCCQQQGFSRHHPGLLANL